MSEGHTTNPVNSIDGFIQPNNLAQNNVPNTRLESSLPSRPRKGFSVSSKDSVPPPGHQLTGKQEHCELSFTVNMKLGRQY